LTAITIAAAQAPVSAKKPLTIELAASERGLDTTAPQAMQWSPDGTKISYLQRAGDSDQRGLFYFDPASGKSAVLIAADKLASLATPVSGTKDDRQKDNRARFGVAAYHWAPDSNSILFDANGRLWLFNLTTATGKPVTAGGEDISDPKFSPDGATVSFVRKHNLYVQPLNGGKEVALTTDGNADLFNGEVDWVYSEELDVRSNYFWSPDSRQILYLQMNESQVPTYPIVDWMQTHPKPDPIKYPKAGDANPTVRLAVTALDGKTKWLSVTDDTEAYIPRFGWVKPGLAWALVMNRLQNKQQLFLIDVASGKTKLVLEETDPYYIELRADTVRFMKDSPQFLWPSWRDGHTHLYLYSFDEKAPLSSKAKLIRQVTKGEWEFSGIKAVDEKAGIVYFTANADDDRQTNLYSIKLDGTSMTRVTPERGVHDPAVADNAKFFVDRYSSLEEPSRMRICGTGPNAACNEVWRSTALEQYATLTAQFVDFKAEDGTVLHGVLVLPPAGAPGAVNGKYPLIMNPYGGPGAMTVRDAFSTINIFDQILATKGFAVLKVDNRGMSGRGRKFAAATYKNLGDLELRDQLAALDQALERFPQLDSNRLGWWGWSYGGSMTLYAMTHSDRFKVGVSVAPVTDWHFYDSIYTERYMGLPQLNPEGYDKASLMRYAHNLTGSLMIVHGTSDDNVHMQNTMQFVNELINNGIQFCLQLYPQKTHSISGKTARTHLYTRIISQFEKGLK
jgi:dipeptidyl-peptidase-4